MIPGGHIVFPSMIKGLTSSLEQVNNSLKKPVGFLQDGLKFGGQIEATADLSKRAEKEISSATSNFFPVTELAVDLLNLEQMIEGSNKKVNGKPLKMMLLILSTTTRLNKVIMKYLPTDENDFALPNVISQRLKAFNLFNKFFSCVITCAESFQKPPSAQKAVKIGSKTVIASLTLYLYFFQHKLMKAYLKPVTAVNDLTNDVLALYDRSHKIMKGEDPLQVSILEVCSTLSSITLSILALATLCYGEAVQLPFLVFILTSVRLGSQVSLYCLGA